MQYILSEQEYKALIDCKVTRAKMSQMKLQTLCTKICNEMPINIYANNTIAPWTCIHSHKQNEWYCDECPVKEICPEPNKNWSH